jgi:hypothetical protein
MGKIGSACGQGIQWRHQDRTPYRKRGDDTRTPIASSSGISASSQSGSLQGTDPETPGCKEIDWNNTVVTVDLAQEKDNLLKAELAVKLAEIQNELDVLQDQFDNPPGPHLQGDNKAKMDGAWRGYNTRVSKLEAYRGRTCSLILGQCTQVLKDKLKHDPDYKTVIDSGNPLQYKSLIEKTIMAQAEDQYNCAAVHDQMCHLLGFSQGALRNDQYYERFNTKVDVSKSVGVSWVQDGITKPRSKALYK